MMSMHRIPLTEIEMAGLTTHGLPIGKPSQLSDVFRHGIKWAQNNTNEAAMTDAELVESALKLADMFYVMQGNISRPGFKFYASTHPLEQLMWDMACAAFEVINGTDIENALAEIEDSE